jgi:hypothetical protein
MWHLLFWAFYFFACGSVFVALRDPQNGDEYKIWPAFFLAITWPISFWVAIVYLLVSAIKKL